MKPIYKIIIISTIGVLVGISLVGFFTKSATKTIIEDVQNNKVTNIDWQNLQALDPQNGNIPATLKKINGTLVKIPGFIIPLEDNQNFVSEFLFVPTPMACIHVPPPPPNQIIHVKMASGRKAKMSYGPVWLTGKIIISEGENKFTKTYFEMIGSITESYIQQ